MIITTFFFNVSNGTQFVDHDFMLTPMNEASGLRPVSRLYQPQPLQKPNEVDAANLVISPTTGSTTVYTASTNEENRSITPVESEDDIHRVPNNQN